MFENQPVTISSKLHSVSCEDVIVGKLLVCWMTRTFMQLLILD